MTSSRFVACSLAALFVALAIIARASPEPGRVTDRDIYEGTAARIIVPDCTDLHCFRVLVPWVLGRLPGPSPLRWKAYAALANAAAAAAVFALCLTFGMGRRAASMASLVSAFGFGSLYTLHDPYTSDPLMFFAGPFITNELLRGRLLFAALAGTIGVVAKEFAAAPFYLLAAYHGVERRWGPARRSLAAGNLAFLVLLLLTLTLMLKFNYGWGGTDSSSFAAGAGIGPWLRRMSPRGIAAAMFNEFGALYVLAPVGFFLAPRQVRLLTIASVPIAGVLAYVQQPDRALWNLHFLAAPLAATVLDRSPVALAGATLAAFTVGNLRVGAQLPIASLGRAALALSVVLAAASAWTALRAVGGRLTRDAITQPGEPPGEDAPAHVGL